MKPLPIDAAMPDIISALRPGRQCLVEAEPGAGKSTRIAPAATQLGMTWLLQPRRVAAIGVAHRIADEQGWQLGQEVGYAVRHDRRGQSQTRCWVATDGVLLRQLYHDPLLEHIDCLFFDEFRERSVAVRFYCRGRVMCSKSYGLNCVSVFYQRRYRALNYNSCCLLQSCFRSWSNTSGGRHAPSSPAGCVAWAQARARTIFGFR